MENNRWQHIKIQNESSNQFKSLPNDLNHETGTDSRREILEANSDVDLIPASCSSPVQPFRLKHVFADLTNDRHAQSDEF